MKRFGASKKILAAAAVCVFAAGACWAKKSKKKAGSAAQSADAKEIQAPAQAASGEAGVDETAGNAPSADASASDEYKAPEDEEKKQASANGANASGDSADAYEEEAGVKVSEKKKSKKGKTWFQKLLYGNSRYIEYDTTKLYTSKIMGGIKLREAKVILKLDTREAGVQTPFQISNYALLLDEKSRHLLFSAVDQYLEDFAERRLSKKAKKTDKKYGKCKGYINYGTVSVMMAAEGKPDVYFGYKFYDKSPYFVITVKPTKNIDPHKGTYDVEDSTEMLLCFTKAQARAFCDAISDEAIEDIVISELEETEGSGKITQGDEY